MTEQNQYTRWKKQLAQVRFPYWKELPVLELYIDQVVTIVNEHLTGIGVEPLTKSMVNNYVKKKVIQAPVKKKYAVNQLVDLLLIGFFKSSFSIDEIRAGIAQVTVSAYPRQAYDQFVTLLNAKLAGTTPATAGDNPQNDALESLAIDTVLNRLKAGRLLQTMRQKQTPLAVTKK